ncbi:helix-turn-helix transcriptional regulator [Streptomyces drozdowiczii]|uniref:Helix-turn-helix domain-containing protein n=1 Tax=Streptomyces drozdowiczii TaxID=202862 RepID=A0ABY6PQL9_9ACTN|nr:helix-turn-helix domain-containing protein [Streptomyces drozdowiczii]MCX0246452.1 helix-turn-helix domain-containing protein [Streptomyces drozdowiczii]UZK54046.1 helix-turn-helix domain-containing protein [Streptomyces drozdowiczii]
MNRDPESWARLGRALRSAREASGLTQADLADAAGVSSRSIQDAEGGKVPTGRRPYTLARVAAALGWPAGAVDDVLDGAAPPGGDGQDVPVQAQLDEETATGAITNAMVRALDNATPAEIREATRLAVDALRRHGVISETDGVQPSTNRANP